MNCVCSSSQFQCKDPQETLNVLDPVEMNGFNTVNSLANIVLDTFTALNMPSEKVRRLLIWTMLSKHCIHIMRMEKIHAKTAKNSDLTDRQCNKLVARKSTRGHGKPGTCSRMFPGSVAGGCVLFRGIRKLGESSHVNCTRR